MKFSALLKYLRLPLQTAPLLVIVSFSVLAVIAQMADMFGVPLLIVLVSWFFKYSLVLVDYVIDGKHEVPPLSAEMVNPFEQRPFGMFLIVALGYVVTMSLEASLSLKLILLIRIALLCLVPAMIASMSITGRLLDALNPMAVFGIIARIPLAYVSLLLVILTLWFVPISLMKALQSAIPHLPSAGLLSLAGAHIPSALGAALFMYLWLAMCACIGGIVYEHRDELDYEAAHTPERREAREQLNLERERDKLLDPIFAEFRGGAFANAGASVRKLIGESSNPLEEFRWLYARASTWPDQRLAEYLAQIGLPRLLEAGATGEALDVARERLKANADFRPTSAAHLLRVAMLARDAGDRATARLLLKDFDQHYPNDAAQQIAAKLNADLSRAS